MHGQVSVFGLREPKLGEVKIVPEVNFAVERLLNVYVRAVERSVLVSSHAGRNLTGLRPLRALVLDGGGDVGLNVRWVCNCYWQISSDNII